MPLEQAEKTIKMYSLLVNKIETLLNLDLRIGRTITIKHLYHKDVDIFYLH